jgi:ACS family tartrate transporter-like MFS transporter
MSEDRVFAKCAWRLLPLVTACYVVNYLDRVNVGFAALTMNRDLGFSPSVFGFGGGILFIGYSLSQVPANYVLTRIGARRWVFCIMACWGVLSASCAFVTGPTNFYVLRFLLGVAEAGMLPAMIFYLSTWFPRDNRGRFIATFQAGIPISFLIGGPVSSLLLQLNGMFGLHGWQWLFLMEGLPAVLLAFAVLLLLPDDPASARWLNQLEKRTVLTALSSESAAAPGAYWPVLRDLRVLVLGMMLFAFAGGQVGYLLWLPQIVAGMGFSVLATGFVIAAMFAVVVPSMILWGRHSDATGERIWHVAISAMLASLGFAAAAAAHDSMLALLALTCAGLGLFLFCGPFLSLPSLLLRGPALACGIALINSIGIFGGFVAPLTMGLLKQQTGSYSTGLMVLAVVMFACAAVALVFGRAVGAQITTAVAKPISA